MEEKSLEFEHNNEEVYSKIWLHLETWLENGKPTGFMTIQCRNIEKGKQEDGVFMLDVDQIEKLKEMLK
jgi:hypothetical protein